MKAKRNISDNLSILIMLILIIVFSVLLFIFRPDYNKKNWNNVLSIDADKYTLTVGDRLPISDYTAVNLEASNIDSDILDEIKFSIATVVDEKINYEIYLVDEANRNYIDTDYIKILLTDEAGTNYNVVDGIVPVFSKLPGSAKFPGNKKIYYGTIEPGLIKQFVVKMWVSDDYLINSDNKTFSTKLIIKVV